MKKTFLVTGIAVTVSAKLVTEGVTFPNDTAPRPMLHNKFRVTVATPSGKTRFNFYGSNHDYMNGVTEMSESDLKHALYCMLSDSMAGEQCYEDFCSEFGYDSDSRKARKIWKACVTQAEKSKVLGLDIYEAANELND
jgi:hypothetical protein